VWSDENLHAIYFARYQQQFSVSIWAGIVGDNLIGPHILPNRLNGEKYFRFLNVFLPELLNEVPTLRHHAKNVVFA
jgi:hypothetical protein